MIIIKTGDLTSESLAEQLGISEERSKEILEQTMVLFEDNPQLRLATGFVKLGTICDDTSELAYAIFHLTLELIERMNLKQFKW